MSTLERDSAVPPHAVRAWFFDLREDDHTRGRHPEILRSKPGDYRHVLSRTDAKVEAEDAYRGGKVKVGFTLTKVGENGIDYDVRGDWYDSTGRLRASPKGAGSHIHFTSDMRWKGFGKLVRPFMEKMLVKAIMADMMAHIEDMEQDWKSQPW